MASPILLNALSVSSFNIARFLFISVILIPLLEASIARIFRLACALRLLQGKSATWNESRIGYLAMHGKYYSRASRLMLYLVSAAALGVYLLLEYGTSATAHYEIAQVEVRKTTPLRAGTLSEHMYQVFIDDVDVGATLDFLRTPLRLTGQRSALHELSGEERLNDPVPRPWGAKPVESMGAYCFKRDQFCRSCASNPYNKSYAEKVVSDRFQPTAVYYSEIRSSYNMTSAHKAMHLRRDNSVLFEEGADDVTVNFNVELFSIQRDVGPAEGIYYHKGGTKASADEFVRRFRRLGIRTTIRRPISQTRSHNGYIQLAANRLFKCILEHQFTEGKVVCHLSVYIGDGGEHNAFEFLDGAEQNWDQTCATQSPSSESGKCLSLLLGGTVVSDHAFNSTSGFHGFVHVLLVDVLSSVEYEGNCDDNEFGDLLILRDISVLNVLKEEVEVSIDAMRRLVLWSIIFSQLGRGFLKDGFEWVNVPLSSSIVPTISMSFISIVGGIAAFIAVEGLCNVGLMWMMRKKGCLPVWLRRLAVAREMQVQGSFRYAVKKMSSRKYLHEGFDEEVGDVRHECAGWEDEGVQSEGKGGLSLQGRPGQYFVAICDSAGTTWDGHSWVG